MKSVHSRFSDDDIVLDSDDQFSDNNDSNGHSTDS